MSYKNKLYKAIEEKYEAWTNGELDEQETNELLILIQEYGWIREFNINDSRVMAMGLNVIIGRQIYEEIQ